MSDSHIENYSCVRLRFVRCRCAAISNKPKSEKCFEKDGVCFVTSGDSMDQDAARQYCADRRSDLPTISTESRKLLFDEFLANASAVTNDQPVWLDIHKNDTSHGLSVTLTNSIYNQEYVLWNAVSVQLLQFARYCCRGHVTLATPTFRKLF